MDSGVLAIIVSIALTAVVLVVTIIGVQQGRRGRFLVRGLGLALVPIGLLLTGVMHLLVNGLRSLGDFFARSQLNAVMITGLVLLVLGLVLFFGGAIGAGRGREAVESGHRTRASRPGEATPGQLEADPRAARPGATPSTTAAAQPQAAPSGRGRPTTNARGKAPKGGLDADDAEIEALLKNRGIE